MNNKSKEKIKRTLEKKESNLKLQEIKITNITLEDLLNDKFLKKMKELSKNTKCDIIPISIMMIFESKESKKNEIIYPITFSHRSKKDFLDKKISFQMDEEKLTKPISNKILKLLMEF